MSLFALPVTVDDILDLQDCIQFFTNEAQATSQAAAINAGTTTVYDYALQLLAANLATSQVAVAVPSLILNETPTVGVIENVTLNFLPDQIDFAVSQGLDPVVYAAEAWAVNVASSNAADFNALYGNLNSTQFAAVVSTTTGVNTGAILNFIANWQAFFSANPDAIPPNLNVTTASYAAAFGDAIGNALVDDSVFTEGVNAFAENALLTICTGQYLEGVAPGDIPQHIPLQGEGPGLRLTINVDNLSTTLPDQVFDAAPETNPILGAQNNTLNTGDTLTDTAGDGTLDFTAIDTAFGLGNPPFALGVTMDGIATANILNLSEFDTAGFSGDITGLTTLTVAGGSVDFGVIQVGAPGLGAGLNTALEQINVNTSQFIDAFFESAALTGAEALDLNLNGVEALLFLDVNGGTTGYGQVDITSAVDPNEVTITTEFDTVATVTVDGDQDLTVHSNTFHGPLFGDLIDVDNVLNVGDLDLFDASAATGDITVGEKCVDDGLPETGFFGTGDVQVLGGSGDDFFVFHVVDGAVDVQGNDGDDVFTFQTDFDDETTFTDADLADGGDGENRLNLEAYQGELLNTGVAASILNIQVIEHYTGIDFDGVDQVTVGMGDDLTVDMSEAGSATTLDLAGDYAIYPVPVAAAVTVSELTNADTVVYSGINLDPLTLEHVSALGIVNLTMAQDLENTCLNSVFGPGTVSEFGLPVDVHVLGALDVETGGQVNLVSTGAADTNAIFDASEIDSDISITGDVDLVIGSEFAYDFFSGVFGNGVVDAAAFEADLQIGLGFNNQTAIGGIGDDFFDVQSSFFGLSVDTIDLSVGGSDTVQFDQTFLFAGGVLFPGITGFEYHTVTGFDVADDTIAINVEDIALQTTLGSILPDVAPEDDPVFFQYQTNTFVDATTFGFNFIKISTPVNTGVLTAQGAFDTAMGFGSIDVAGLVFGLTNEVLGSFYDATNEQMVLFTVDADTFGIFDSSITAGDDIDVVALVEMNQADYNAFDATNLAFTADWDPFA